MLANLGRLLSLGMLSFFQALAQQPSLRRYLMTERPLNRLCIAIDTIHPARDVNADLNCTLSPTRIAHSGGGQPRGEGA